LELKKIQLEILELQKPWVKKPTFIVPLIGAISSIFILWVTGFFNTKIEGLSNKREILNFENSKLEEKRKSLQIDLKNLRDSLDIAMKPNLSIQVIAKTSDKEVGFQVQNTGTGTAYFKHFNMYYKGQSFIGGDIKTENYFARVAKAMNIFDSFECTFESKELSDSYEKAGSLGPGQNYFPLKLVKDSYTNTNATIFLKAIEGLEVEIEYYTTNGKSYKVKKRLEYYERAN
jgi:hypothetical protein